jgi:hypothetical protein
MLAQYFVSHSTLPIARQAVLLAALELFFLYVNGELSPRFWRAVLLTTVRSRILTGSVPCLPHGRQYLQLPFYTNDNIYM